MDKAVILIPISLFIAIFFMPYVISVVFFPYFLIKRLIRGDKR